MLLGKRAHATTAGGPADWGDLGDSDPLVCGTDATCGRGSGKTLGLAMMQAEMRWFKWRLRSSYVDCGSRRFKEHV